MEASEYHEQLLDVAAASPYFESISLDYSAGAEEDCYVRGWIRLLSGHTLYTAEYLKLKPTPLIAKYRYQLLDADNNQVCRWDNAHHHPAISTHPHHEHLADQGIYPSTVRNLDDVLLQLPRFIA